MCLNLNTSSVYRTQLPAPPRRGLRGHVTLEKKSLLKEISESCHDNTAGTSGLCALNDNWALPWLYIHVRWDPITYPIESSEHQNGGAANVTMKVLVVLTIAVVSGCQANLFYADAPKPQLEVLTDAFWDYVAKATQTADDTLQMVRKSQFGQDVSARLTESADMASKYAVSIQEQLPPGAQDLITKVTTEADVLRERVTQELSTVRNKLEPYTEDMKAKVQARVEQLKQELAPYADSVDSEALRATLMQKSEELKSSLEQSVKDLQAQLGPYTDDLKLKVDGHLQNFQQNLAPMSDKFQLEFSQRASMVKQMVAPYAEDLREKLDPYAQDLQAQLMSLYQSFVKAN